VAGTARAAVLPSRENYEEQPEFNPNRKRPIRMTPEAQKMIEHITKLIRQPNVNIDVNTPLVSSGLIDSMALVDLLMNLEDLTHQRIPAGKVQPKDLDTVSLMFATAQRVGKPRK
jgi:acyl carrier protein